MHKPGHDDDDDMFHNTFILLPVIMNGTKVIIVNLNELYTLKTVLSNCNS
jgi:hypothetical protein